MINNELLIERRMAERIINIRHPQTGEILAIKYDNQRWKSDNREIQKICNEWSGGSTAGGLASEIAKVVLTKEAMGPSDL